MSSPLRTSPITKWKGTFGDQYIERNRIEEREIPLGIEGFRRMLGAVTPRSILEVGSSIGLNLRYLRMLLGEAPLLYAVDPNFRAVKEAKKNPEIDLEDGFCADACALPFKDRSFDLVFTCGVLIHVPPESVEKATDEIVRVSERYLLCAEYFSQNPEAKPYRGQTGLLFKRDFGSLYLDRHPNLRCLRYGFIWKRELRVFDDVTWWLFEKG